MNAAASRFNIVPLSLFAGLAVLATVALGNLRRTPAPPAIGPASEVLYLPSGRALLPISFGYRNTLADLLWFNTNMYFAKHLRGDRAYRWLFHMIDLVTTLNPRAFHAYEFGGVILAWEAHDPDASVRILTKGIANLPLDWRPRYIRAMIYSYFLKQPEAAQADFVAGSQLPDAPPLLAQLAARVVSSEGSAELAVSFLKGLIESTDDADTRKAFAESLAEAEAKLATIREQKRAEPENLP